MADERTDARVIPFPERDAAPAPATPATDAHRPADPEPGLADLLGDVLRDERRHQGRTLADVADAAAVSLPYLSEVERGRKEASSAVIGAVVDALGLDLADVLDRAAERSRAERVEPLLAEPDAARTTGTRAGPQGVGRTQLRAA